jgi:hypothetical protein
VVQQSTPGKIRPQGHSLNAVGCLSLGLGHSVDTKKSGVAKMVIPNLVPRDTHAFFLNLEFVY